MNNSDTDRIIAERFGSLVTDATWQPNLSAGLARLNEERAARRGRTRRRVLLASGIAAVCLPVMAFPVTRAFAAHCVSACVTGTSAVREFLLGSAPGPPASATYVKPEDRRMAPGFVLNDALNDASGQPVRLSDFRGKVVLLNFWATWCAPCNIEIPWFVDFQRSKQPRGFSVLGVSMDDGGWAAVKPYIDAHNVNYTVTIGNEKVAALFGGSHPALPLTLIIDRSGRIAAIHAGLCSRAEYEADIDAVLNER